MKLLITTQAVDLDDPVLGFMHRWIEEIAAQCESVAVICLKRGRSNLPSNVSIYSLGKEAGVSRATYLIRFFTYIWMLQRRYDAVFVHMNQEYVLLGGLLWRAWGKRVVLWRNHKMGSWMTTLAAKLSTVVCYTSDAAYVAHFKNARKMPIGIDTNVFKPSDILPTSNSILFLGRIDEVKKPIMFVEALKNLVTGGLDFHTDIYGDPTYAESPYFAQFKSAVAPLAASGHVTLHPSIPNHETPSIYASHALYVNLTPSGSFDKTIGEAMACGCIAVVANAALADTLPSDLLVDPSSQESIERGIRSALEMDESTRGALADASRAYVEREHALSLLVSKLVQLYE